MPAHTPSPSAYRSIAAFWAELIRLDDGELNLWNGIELGWGLKLDVLLLDRETGAFCIEVCNLDLNFITHLESQSMIRRDGVVYPSPFALAMGGAQALASVLDRDWEERPDLTPVAAFPLVSRSEWMARFSEDVNGEFGERCLLREDLESVEALRARLDLIAAKPVSGRARSPRFCGLAEGDVQRVHEALLGEKLVSASVETESIDALPLLDETIALVKGPGAAFHSPGLDSLVLWRAALSELSDRLRVSVVGEFKSGKSSLINAILGRNACYVDEFEATSISATYTDGADEDVELLDEQNDAAHLRLDDFLARCAAKDLAGVRRVVVTLPTGLPFDIVDSPGLGTQTEGHTDEAEAEIRRTDLLLWTVDGNDPGSAREGAFIQRAREVGLPIFVLLTKADTLQKEEIGELVEYVANETGISRENVIALSAWKHQASGCAGVTDLLERLYTAASRKAEFQTQAQGAKLLEAIDGSRSTLRFLLEVNSSHARFLATERGYLEASTLGISKAAKSEWLRVLREECAGIASSIASKSIEDADVVELMLSKALPGAVNRATTRFLQSLSRLVRDEWRSALEERSREFESRLGELLISRPDAKADLDFLRSQTEAFRIRAEVIGSEDDMPGIDNRLLIMGLGAAASVVTVSILPIAVAGVVAAIALRGAGGGTSTGITADTLIASKIEQALIVSFDSVSDIFERAIDRIVHEVALRSLVKLVKRRGGPDFLSIVIIQRKACDLMDELTAVR